MIAADYPERFPARDEIVRTVTTLLRPPEK